MSGRRYAVYGDVLPDGRRPFRCLDCGTLVGHSQRGLSELVTLSVHVGTTPDGVPRYGGRRGHSPRLPMARLRLAAERYTRFARRDLDNAPDYAFIAAPQFETWCPACRARLRVEVPAAGLP